MVVVLRIGGRGSLIRSRRIEAGMSRRYQWFAARRRARPPMSIREWGRAVRSGHRRLIRVRSKLGVAVAVVVAVCMAMIMMLHVESTVGHRVGCPVRSRPVERA